MKKVPMLFMPVEEESPLPPPEKASEVKLPEGKNPLDYLPQTGPEDWEMLFGGKRTKLGPHRYC